MQRRHRHATRRLHLEVLEPRQLLSRSDEVLRLAAAAMPSRTATEGGPLNLTGAEHDLIAEQIVHRPRLAARQGLGTLAAMMARHRGYAAHHGWGATLDLVLSQHPRYAARHHLGALMTSTAGSVKRCQ